MYVLLLFLAAFLFFTADRKVRLAFIPGILTTVIACFGFVTRYTNLVYAQNYRYMSTMKPYSVNGSIRLFYVLILMSIVAPICCFALMSLGKLFSVAVFKASKDGNGYKVLARVFFIISGVIMIVIGIYFLNFRNFMLKPSHPDLYKFIKVFGVAGFARADSYTVFGAIIIALGILPVILIFTKIFSFKQIKEPDPSKARLKLKTGMSTTGIVLSITGNAGTIITALVGLIVWHQVYFYNGYGYTKILCTLFLFLMLLGLIFTAMALYKIAVKGQLNNHKSRMILSLILIGLSLADSAWLISNALKLFLTPYGY